jgi:hypothetical protein
VWNRPTQEELATLPRLYATEGVPAKDKPIYLHFFLSACDWYAAEFDGEDTFFGFAILNSDHQNSEWGYFSLQELAAIKVSGWLEVDRDLGWQVRPAGLVPEIKV